jgi:hypothetical protein
VRRLAHFQLRARYIPAYENNGTRIPQHYTGHYHP